MFENTLQGALIGVTVIPTLILSLPTTSFVRYAIYPLPALLVLRALLWPPTEGLAKETYLLGLLMTDTSFKMFDYLYLQGYNAPAKFLQVDRVGRTITKVHEYPKDTLGQVKWALSLVTSHRGIGWNIQVPLQKIKYPSSRVAYIFESMVSILSIYLGLYTCGSLCDYMVQVLRKEADSPYPWVYGLFKNSIFQMVVAFMGIFAMVSNSVLVYNLARMICVTSGIKGNWGKIESWPNMFGEFEDAWSIRNVWGRAWHQNLRRCLTAPGEKVSSLIFGSSPKLGRVPRLIRRYFLVFSAFGVSGLLHSLAVYYGSKTDTMPYEDSTPLHMRPGWYVTGYFFYIQPFAITLEDFICWATGTSTESKGVKATKVRWFVGMVYTLTWFTWGTAVLWIHPQLASLGYQRTSDAELGYVHILVSTSEAASILPLNPWPAVVKTVSPMFWDVYGYFKSSGLGGYLYLYAYTTLEILGGSGFNVLKSASSVV
ncbi:hypothetical protein TWF225_004807 [Orbilia oligospora]|nr:hypothetical protein TWF225_004807 [Orbilia oligospora]KAF3272695.1 hypothetical protein TWF217_000168 [Orbilia oligospora]KAF3293012.1 hypothetical protein TWF132_005014 [Orbilia oligospora]